MQRTIFGIERFCRLKRGWSFFVVAFFCIGALAAAAPLAQGQCTNNSTSVNLSNGVTICGNAVTATNGNAVNAYLGIPYVKSQPVGTGPAGRWTVTTTGGLPTQTTQFSTYGPPCIQPTAAVQKIMSESCLFLNIWVPASTAQKPANGWPVMIFIHGGAFVVGSGGSQADVVNGIDNNLYNGTNFAGQNVILVTLNYRLGALGFFGGHMTDATIPYNLALIDQENAINWVANYIGNFGGNSKLMTLFGESAGAMSVGLHTFAMSGQGVTALPYQAAIMESNPYGSDYPDTSSSAAFARAAAVNASFMNSICKQMNSGAKCTTGPAVTYTNTKLGIGASATAVVNGSGAVESVTRDTYGVGYSDKTQVQVPGGSPQASVTPTIGLGGRIVSYTVASGGGGYAPPTSSLAYLQSVPVGVVLAASNHAATAGLLAFGAFNLPWTPIVDGSTVYQEPFNGFQPGVAKIPVAFGVNQNEGAVFAALALKEAKESNDLLSVAYRTELLSVFGANSGILHYTRYAPDSQTNVPPYATKTSMALANMITDYGMWCSSAYAMDSVVGQSGTVYGYEFAQAPFSDVYNLNDSNGDAGACAPIVPGFPSNVCHADELPYVFNNLNAVTGGSSAAAVAAVSNGAISNATLTYGGWGYKGAAPTVTLKSANGSGNGAAATATLTEGSVFSVVVSDGGSGYSAATPPAVSISGSGSGATALAVVNGKGMVSSIVVTSGGSGYGESVQVSVAPPGGTGGKRASATANLYNPVSGLQITESGTGYSSPVQVTFSGEAASSTPPYTPTTADYQIATAMNTAWADFAKDPSSPGTEWYSYKGSQGSNPFMVGQWINGGYNANGTSLQLQLEPVGSKNLANAKSSTTPNCIGLWFNQTPFAGDSRKRFKKAR